MAKNSQHQNGVIPGGAGTGPDDFSDGESIPLTQDYVGRYSDFNISENDSFLPREQNVNEMCETPVEAQLHKTLRHI